ncbi:AAA family ATPase [Xanthovirga aplysinae]|uniref:AAA family ATPase n=1 Tax=Xanthovirga aplysinae TaxID=2529853 RepID=UPI0012BD5304|nr:AAA family ATPase [Xanthovirga aplysinae]MTI33020.1 hypothetical protein [Xanthovirga aplysinae]
MKIAVVGAHRTGKSTLIEELKGSLPEYIFKDEPYYLMDEEGHIFSDIPSLDDYILQLEFSIELIADSEQDVIFDRCPIDMLAYIQAQNELDTDYLSLLYHKVENVITELDLIVFLPIEEPDGIGCDESDLPQLRKEVDEILHDLVWDFGIEVMEVQGSPLSRKNQVMKHIQK